MRIFYNYVNEHLFFVREMAQTVKDEGEKAMEQPKIGEGIFCKTTKMVLIFAHQIHLSPYFVLLLSSTL